MPSWHWLGQITSFIPWEGQLRSTVSTSLAHSVLRSVREIYFIQEIFLHDHYIDSSILVLEF